MEDFDGWQVVGEPLGRGGQGVVYRARSLQRAQQMTKDARRASLILWELRTGAPSVDEVPKRVEELALNLGRLSGPDPIEGLGALKQFRMPSDDASEAEQAVGRLKSEVDALQAINHPAVLKLLHASIDKRFIVTQFHQRGTLDKNLNLYRGNALAALGAFRSLVEGVNEIHRQGAIHRDIKPENIFVGDSGSLVLGDLGIVFFQGGGRLTTTFERVGSHYWMAPWAYKNKRLDYAEVKPTLDIFPLGKVLWSMISGVNGFPYWEFAEDDNNLEKLFPGDPSMPLVNELLAKCISRYEKDCRLSIASDLLLEVDRLISSVRTRSRFRPKGEDRWPCQVCGKGNYQSGSPRQHVVEAYYWTNSATKDKRDLRVSICDHCGHVELFAE